MTGVTHIKYTLKTAVPLHWTTLLPNLHFPLLVFFTMPVPGPTLISPPLWLYDTTHSPTSSLFQAAAPAVHTSLFGKHQIFRIWRPGKIGHHCTASIMQLVHMLRGIFQISLWSPSALKSIISWLCFQNITHHSHWHIPLRTTCNIDPNSVSIHMQLAVVLWLYCIIKSLGMYTSLNRLLTILIYGRLILNRNPHNDNESMPTVIQKDYSVFLWDT